MRVERNQKNRLRSGFFINFDVESAMKKNLKMKKKGVPFEMTMLGSIVNFFIWVHGAILSFLDSTQNIMKNNE